MASWGGSVHDPPALWRPLGADPAPQVPAPAVGTRHPQQGQRPRNPSLHSPHIASAVGGAGVAERWPSPGRSGHEGRARIIWGRLRCMAMLGAIRVFKRIVVFEEFYDCKGSIRLFSIMQYLLRKFSYDTELKIIILQHSAVGLGGEPLLQ